MHRDGQIGTGRSHVPSLQIGIQEISRTVVSHIEQIGSKTRRCDFDQVFELQSQSKTVTIENQAKKSHNPFLLNNIGDGILLPQVIPGGIGTRPKAGGAREKSILFKKLFVAAGFVPS